MENEIKKQFNAPQMIEKDSKRYGLDKQQETGISYFQLAQQGELWKRTDQKMQTSAYELARDIREGKTKVLMPSKQRVQEIETQKFAESFKAPAMIQKADKTFGLDKHEGQQLSYIKLEKPENQKNQKWKRTEERLETSPSELAKGIKDGEVKVLMANKEFVKEREQAKQIVNKSLEGLQEQKKPNEQVQQKKQTEVKEVQPIHIEPLTARERKEVKEAMQENKLDDNKHANHLYKKFDKQLNSVPDKLNGQQMNNQDKLKLLVGDLNDHKNTAYKVEKDKTVSFSNGNEKGQINNINSQFSPAQLEKKQQSKANEKGLSV